MSKFSLSKKSESRLVGVHPDLVAVVRRAIEITEVDFSVGEGLRTIERQKELVAKGASQTMKSRHLTGHSVDLYAIVDSTVSWEWKYYAKISESVSKASKELGVDVEWGGNWKMKDGPHFQLTWAKYPK